MIIYNGKLLIKFKNKNGGKNQSEVDGFYRDPDGVEYFIKKPKDPKELFTELFAGLLLQEFIRRQLIDKIYHASFICAQLIQFEDGSYGLIQPMTLFTELYKIIGTGYSDGSDRDPLTEIIHGPESYVVLTQLKHYFGLAIVLMYSLLFGDHSVHSGNVVCLDVATALGMLFIQFARIDWGAAFRYFGYKKNNENLLHPLEYQGLFNPKGYTKGYFLNYKKIKGLFPAIAEQACLLQKRVDESLFVDMVNSVLRQLPVDLLDTKTKKELAQYLGMESFININFGEANNQFSQDFAVILSSRLKKMTVLQDFPIAAANSDLPAIYLESLPTVISLPVNNAILFDQQMNIWLNIFSSPDGRTIFDFNSIDRVQLAKQYNFFMECLLRQAEQFDQLLDYGDLPNPFDGKSTLPHPLSCFLRNQFTLGMDLKPYFSHTEQRISCKNTYWKLVESVLTSSFNAMVTIRVLQSTQNTTTLCKGSAIHLLFDALRMYLDDFNRARNLFLRELQNILFSMSGAQLVRICLNEMEFINSSMIVELVMRNAKLWVQMNQALTEAYEMLYDEKMGCHITNLRKLQENYILFLTVASESWFVTQLGTKKIIVNKLCRLFESLPGFLQRELVTILNQIQDQFRRQSQHLLELEESQPLNEKLHVTLEKDNGLLFFSPNNAQFSILDSNHSSPLSTPLKIPNK
ncbi:substrate of the Dot/Icm secretion system, LepB-like [Legionella steigerwaltii]|uniref:Effector protein B n=1 Tax=Legionella steigerwaltii TaxID=460 RepID=A0A378L7V4_9GAMM|nr:LepB GTPase-activating domain-containing protein [Legionella steigerwaltii]KTD77001.1 putative effector protein B [Legionella steigerwaltii]STY22430.1 substrate of the Dot/Icm secretion system, LepB-like [Legionella steigerwaltii]